LDIRIKINRKTRKILTTHKILCPKADIDMLISEKDRRRKMLVTN